MRILHAFERMEDYGTMVCASFKFITEPVVIFAFDEEERILIVSFLPKSLSRVLWTSAAGIERDAMRFQRLGAILDWPCGTFSFDLMCYKCFLGRGELEFTRAVKLPLEVERLNALY